MTFEIEELPDERAWRRKGLRGRPILLRWELRSHGRPVGAFETEASAAAYRRHLENVAVKAVSRDDAYLKRLEEVIGRK